MRPWCQLAYWELADRVGKLYSVQGRSVNVSSAAEPANQGLCLATLANHAPSRQAGSAPAVAVERTRTKIGLGKYRANLENLGGGIFFILKLVLTLGGVVI